MVFPPVKKFSQPKDGVNPLASDTDGRGFSEPPETAWIVFLSQLWRRRAGRGEHPVIDCPSGQCLAIGYHRDSFKTISFGMG